MRDILIAAVRTGVVAVATIVVAWLAGVGIDVDPSALEVVLTGVAVGVVNLALNWLQTKFPFLGQLMSLGLSKSTPTY